MRTLEEKLAIIEEANRPNASVALVARKHGVNANQVFGWLRLHRRGLLESGRHGKPTPLMPVKIATPTLTPTERASSPSGDPRGSRADSSEVTAEAMLELVLSDGHASAFIWRDSAYRTRSHPQAADASMIALAAGSKVWLVAGATDMRKGFDGLA